MLLGRSSGVHSCIQFFLILLPLSFQFQLIFLASYQNSLGFQLRDVLEEDPKLHEHTFRLLSIIAYSQSDSSSVFPSYETLYSTNNSTFDSTLDILKAFPFDCLSRIQGFELILLKQENFVIRALEADPVSCQIGYGFLHSYVAHYRV